MNGNMTCWIINFGGVKETIVNNAVLEHADFYLSESEAWDAVEAKELAEAGVLDTKAASARARAKAAREKARLSQLHVQLTGTPTE